MPSDIPSGKFSATAEIRCFAKARKGERFHIKQTCRNIVVCHACFAFIWIFHLTSLTLNSNSKDVPSDQPSDIPSSTPSESPTGPPPCKDVSCNNAGKCALSPDDPTKPTCMCENTFELTFDRRGKPSCTCNAESVFHADVNRCFPITSAPSSAPTLVPSLTQVPSLSPSQTPSIEKCVDNELATFTLINLEKSVGCSWILQNKKRASVRKERYCGLERVTSICPESCGLC